MDVEGPMFAEAAAELRASVRAGRSFEIAQMRLIGLDAVQRAAGDNWSSIGPRVRTGSMLFLRARLSSGDVVLPAGDGFLIIFAQAKGRDLDAAAREIQRGLNAFYMGDSATTFLRAEIKRETIEPGGMLRLLAGAGGAEPPNAPPLRTHDFASLPVWCKSKEAVTAYWITPRYYRHGAPYYGYDAGWADPRMHSAPDCLALDLSILERMVQEAERCIANGERCLISYSVHATTLQHRQTLNAYLMRLYAIPERLRPYFVARIAEIEPGTPTAALSDWVHLLRPVSRRVVIHLHESDRALSRLDETGAFCVAFTLSNRQHTKDGRDAYIRCFERWAAAVKDQRIHLQIDNAVERGLLGLCMSNSAEYLTSDRYWPAQSPSGVKRASLHQLKRALSAGE